MTKTRFNPWPWLPLFVIGAAALANGTMIFMAGIVHPQKVEEQPFVASSRIDGEKLAAERFTTLGFTFAIKAIDAKNLTLSITGNTSVATPATVQFYRPNNPLDDHSVAWEDPTKPLTTSLVNPGMWRLRVNFTDNNGAELRAEGAIDTIAVTTP